MTTTLEKRRYAKSEDDKKSEKITIRLTPHSRTIIRAVIEDAIGPISLSEVMERIAKGELKLTKV